MGLIYGVNPIIEAIDTGKTINKIYLAKGTSFDASVMNRIKEKNIVTVNSDKSKLDFMITPPNEKLKNSQGIVAQITDYIYYDIEDIIEDCKAKGMEPKIAVLDKIEDPHNLGAIIRSAECLGFNGVVIQKRNAVQVTDIVEKVSAGAVSHMKIARVTNISDTIETLKKAGLWVYGLDMEGASSIYDTDLTGPIAIVVGNEGDGITRLVRQHCDGIIKIPMLGKMESLNASASMAIVMYEVLRQSFKK